jgi:hypothetical protein
MGNMIKGIPVGREVTAEHFKKEIVWEKRCACCNSSIGKTAKAYNADDMLGNGVQIGLLNIHQNQKKLYGYIKVLCDDCNLLYNGWKNL